MFRPFVFLGEKKQSIEKADEKSKNKIAVFLNKKNTFFEQLSVRVGRFHTFFGNSYKDKQFYCEKYVLITKMATKIV